MRVRLVRRPGQHGTREYVERYGDRLVCVRYRYDAAARRRYKTVEIIVDEAPWEPPPAAPAYGPDTLVGIRLPAGQRQLAEAIARAGGVRRDRLGVWALRYDLAAALGLHGYIVDTVAAMAEAWNRRSSDASRGG